MQGACQKYEIGYSVTDTKVVMWYKLRKYIQANISPVIVQMAGDAGHELLYSSPHYSDSQPIETVWGIIKGAFGRQYTTTTTSKDVLIRTNKAFLNLQSQTVRGCIEKVNKNLGKNE